MIIPASFACVATFQVLFLRIEVNANASFKDATIFTKVNSGLHYVTLQVKIYLI